jgi:deoxyadenosine/deoxycytidine kinase
MNSLTNECDQKNTMLRILEGRWRALVRHKTTAAKPVLSICGPSGVGKTTVVTALANEYPTFIETTKGNPHLNRLLVRKSEFNAGANQGWFLRRIGQHISRASSCFPLVLDQDPSAIVLAYSRMFLEEGKITDAQYVSLMGRLLKIEGKLQSWRCPRTVLLLDAPADVLCQRVFQRWGKSRTPPLEWFERVRDHFVRLFRCFPNTIVVSTVKLSSDQVIARARSLIEERSQISPTELRRRAGHGCA